MAARPQVIAGPDVPPTIGPYSPAVRVGDLLFVSGGGIDPSTGKPAGESFREQARQVFRNLDAVLRARGSNPTLVVNTTVLVADVSSFPELNELFGEFLLRGSAGSHDDAGSAPAGPADLDRVCRRNRGVTPGL